MGKLKIHFERFFKLINEKSFENRIAVFTKKPLKVFFTEKTSNKQKALISNTCLSPT